MAGGDGGPPKLQCWICLAEDEPEDLIQPCGCRGSIGFVHEECLKTWLASRVSRIGGSDPSVFSPKCPNCQQTYSLCGSDGQMGWRLCIAKLDQQQRRELLFRFVQHLFLLMPVLVSFFFKMYTLGYFIYSNMEEGEGPLLIAGPVWGTVPLFSSFTSPLEGGSIVSHSGISEKWSSCYIAIQRADQWKVMCWVVFEVFGFLMEFEWHELLNEQPGLARRFLFFEVLPYAYNRIRVFSTLLMSKCDTIPHVGPYLSEFLRLFLYSWYTSHIDVLVNLVSELAAAYFFTDFVVRSLFAQYKVITSLVLLQSGDLRIKGTPAVLPSNTDLVDGVQIEGIEMTGIRERGRVGDGDLESMD